MIIKTEPAATGQMNKGEAKALTDRIRQAVDGLGSLVEQAYDRGAWKAMGYVNWESYVKDEFGFTRQRSYQLLDQGRIAKALAEATGDLSTTVDISERAARDLKPALSAAKSEISERVEGGQAPAEAVKEVVTAKVAARRAEKEKAKAEKHSKQAENDAYRDQNRAALSAPVKVSVQARETAKAAKKPATLPAEDRIAELEEHVTTLERENAELKAKVKKFGEMEIEYLKGGFEEVIRGKDSVIDALKSRVERESADKVSWKKSSDMWRKRAEEAGWSNDIAIDLETGAVGRA